MKIAVTRVLHDLEGLPLRDAKVVNDKGVVLRPERDFTLRKACTEALQAQGLPDDVQDGEEKNRRFLLAIRIMTEDEPDLNAEEISKLKRLIGLAFPSIVVGRAYEILDPKPEKASPA